MGLHTMTEELPKLDLLIKMMKMTGAEDNIALVAIRKANEMLKHEGWDWERLLQGKVKIIADPFNTVAAPPETRTAPPPTAPTWKPFTPPPPPSWNPTPRQPRPTPRPRATPPPSGPTARTNVNRFAGLCTKCSNAVDVGAGFVVKQPGTQTWKLECTPCNLA